MDENHQDKPGSKPIATEDKLWLPPLSPKDQEKLDRLQNNRRKAIIKRTGFSDKTLWDWLNLIAFLLVPLMIGVFTISLNIQQNELSQRQHDSDQRIAVDNRRNDLQIADEQQKEAVLVNYQKDISDLLLIYKLRSSKGGDEVREVARTKTITALRRLDPLRKGFLIQFLYEAQLITGQSPIISLRDADLSDISLGSNIKNNRPSVYAVPVGESNHCHLRGINWDSADLKDAYLRNADLSNASVVEAYLGGADLRDYQKISVVKCGRR